MPPRGDKEPTRQQLGKLAYTQDTPLFLQKLKNRIAGVEEEEEDEDPTYHWDGTGRAPLPRRPAVPERPDGENGSDDEDDGDEKPQVVVLREGKHLTEREAVNAKRAEKGLKPLPDPVETPDIDLEENTEAEPAKEKQHTTGLSFSSGKLTGKSGKRKAVGVGEDAGDDKVKKKKPKKESKKLLSFGDDA